MLAENQSMCILTHEEVIRLKAWPSNLFAALVVLALETVQAR
jgi:hypothetical protein